jgi:2-iminobutanoate/2-iminopropanoate deaminase
MQKQIVKTDKAPAAIGPYSQAVIGQGLIFVSGQLGINPETGKLLEGVENQTEQALKNIKNILESANSSLENVLKATIYLKDINDYAKVNKIYAGYFTQNPPARAAFQVAALPRDALIEIEVIAIA